MARLVLTTTPWMVARLLAAAWVLLFVGLHPVQAVRVIRKAPTESLGGTSSTLPQQPQPAKLAPPGHLSSWKPEQQHEQQGRSLEAVSYIENILTSAKADRILESAKALLLMRKNASAQPCDKSSAGCAQDCSCSWWQTCYPKHVAEQSFGECGVSTRVMILLTVYLFFFFGFIVSLVRACLLATQPMRLYRGTTLKPVVATDSDTWPVAAEDMKAKAG